MRPSDMRLLRDGFFPVLLLLAAALSHAQGGAGGYGQGGQGGGPGSGGMGGGGMGGGLGGGYMGSPPGVEAPSPDNRKARPDEEEAPNLWQTKSAVLTPGDRVEFKLAMKKGETLIASASSDAFDPALSIEDSKGKVLLKNDDRSEGDQSPLVIYRFAEAGNYTLKVLSFRSVSGGKFTAKFRSFVAWDAPIGPAVFGPIPQSQDSNRRYILRVGAAKGKIYDLRQVFATKPYTFFPTFVRLIGPTGVEVQDFERIGTSDGSVVFKALSDGDFYIEYESYNLQEFRSNIREVAVTETATKGEESFDVKPGELRIVEFKVSPNQIVRTTVEGNALSISLTAPAGTNIREQGGDPAYGNNAYWAWFKLNRDSENDVVRIFHGDGLARFAIRSEQPTDQKISFKNSDSLPAWTTGAAMNGKLGIGDSALYVIKSTKSELMKVLAKAPQFVVKLDIFRLNGELANSLMNRKTLVATDDLYFPDADTFLVRISCDGYGGSGEYTMKRDTLVATPYTLGTATTMTLDGANFGLYTVELEAGKRYQLTTDQPENFLRADLLDEDGQFLVSQRVRFDKVDVQYFVPTRSGKHRLWLRGAPGVRHFKFEVHVPPSVGG